MSKLHVLWTTGEREVAMKVVLPYLFHGKANGWWDEMNLIIWGPSAKLVAEDREIQLLVQDILDSGITIEACKVCTDAYGITEIMNQLEIPVRYVGSPLTAYLKDGEKVITF
jgi:hypothetical protein